MKKRGSITVFLSLIIVLTATVIGALIEAVRWKGADCEISMRMNLGLDSLFAEYNRELLDRYGVAFLDASFDGPDYSEAKTEAHLKKYLKEWEKSGRGTADLLRVGLTDVKLTDHMLATDNRGEALLSQISGQYGVSGTGAGSLSGEAAGYASLGDLFRQRKEQSDAELRTLEDSHEENGLKLPDDTPMDRVKTMQSGGLLHLVVKDTSGISTKQIQSADLVSTRTLRRGTMNREYNSSMSETSAHLAFTEYVLDTFGNAASPAEDGDLAYEAEYILMGRYSDGANLEAVSQKLLLYREGANLTYLMTDTAKQEEAYAMAAALAGVVAPELVGAVQKAVLLAWAYAESVSDVRALLGGGKVPLVKTEGTWNTSLENIGKDVPGEAGSEDGGTGYSYTDYLRMLFYTGARDDYCLRCMDLMERSVRKTPGNESFRMDNCIVLADFTTEWKPGGAILPFPGLNLLEDRTLRCEREKGYY